MHVDLSRTAWTDVTAALTLTADGSQKYRIQNTGGGRPPITSQIQREALAYLVIDTAAPQVGDADALKARFAGYFAPADADDREAA